ncbi:DUF7838 family putative zinc beta-ribbon protein [Halomarina pelagica]|uniref:DUF7838 family putative zinc beta-ribbon protein n=1 Tax=Halomarina pelagica TaxID=2961599 RepID=UPI0020C4E0DD|nr:hypothetical protein [Halomarina sp. BND7]
MSLETRHYCPQCGGEREFYRTASTLIHLGEKTKWRCTECDYGFVMIGDDIVSDADVSA